MSRLEQRRKLINFSLKAFRSLTFTISFPVQFDFAYFLLVLMFINACLSSFYVSLLERSLFLSRFTEKRLKTLSCKTHEESEQAGRF